MTTAALSSNSRRTGRDLEGQSAAFDDEHSVRARSQSSEAVRLIARVGEVVTDTQVIGLPEHLDACGPAAEDDMFDRALRVRLRLSRLTRFGLDEVDVASGIRRRR